MKTLIISALFMSLMIWSRNNESETDAPIESVIYGKCSTPINKKDEKKNTWDLNTYPSDFKTLFHMYSGPNPKGNRC